MAFDGNGNWVSEYYPEAGDRIEASVFRSEHLEDLERTFENCLTRDGQGKPTTNFNANNYRVINVKDPEQNKDAVNKQTLDSTIATLYPVGSIYIGTQATCPLETLISGSTWELVAENRALWGGDGTNANTTIDSALPNITGGPLQVCAWGQNTETKGALSATVTGSSHNDSGGSGWQLRLNAHDSNEIYKDDQDIVQPPAYVVNVWRRTA